MFVNFHSNKWPSENFMQVFLSSFCQGFSSLKQAFLLEQWPFFNGFDFKNALQQLFLWHVYKYVFHFFPKSLFAVARVFVSAHFRRKSSIFFLYWISHWAHLHMVNYSPAATCKKFERRGSSLKRWLLIFFLGLETETLPCFSCCERIAYAMNLKLISKTFDSSTKTISVQYKRFSRKLAYNQIDCLCCIRTHRKFVWI